MLSLNEFRPGYLSNATGLSLFLPRGRHEYPALVTDVTGTLVAVVLEGTHQHVAFDCGTNRSWGGIIVPKIGIELDPHSMIDLDRHDAPSGILVRRKNELCIAAKPQGGFRSQVLLAANLPECPDDLVIGFAKWRIVVGELPNKRILKSIEIEFKPE